VLDEIVQIRRDTRAAKRLLERLLRKQGCPPKRMITDKLGSYGAARRKILPKVEHRQHKGLNNRAENSHVPIRKRERAMQGFRSWSGLQKFLETFSAVRNHFVPPHSHRSAIATHLHRLAAATQFSICAGFWNPARDLHIRSISEHGRMNWQKTSSYNRRSKVEAAIGRYKRVIGDALRSREDARRHCELKIAVKTLNRMFEFGRPVFVRTA
jgi:hypothetical protein